LAKKGKRNRRWKVPRLTREVGAGEQGGRSDSSPAKRGETEICGVIGTQSFNTGRHCYNRAGSVGWMAPRKRTGGAPKASNKGKREKSTGEGLAKSGASYKKGRKQKRSTIVRR